MSEVALGAALPVRGAVSDLVALAQDAEALGYEYVWVTDDRLQKDVFGILAAIAQATRSVRLGPGVTNPFSRHPCLIAAAIATIDELSGGRAVLGLGAGGTNHRALGIERHEPVAGMAEAITVIRGLLAGEDVNIDGAVIRAREARLDFEPLRATIPIHVGARAPRMLALAGGAADGAIVGNLASREGWAYAVDRIRAGAERSGRDPEKVTLTAWFYCSIDDDSARALDAVRPMVATSLATSRAILSDIGVDLPGSYTRFMDGRNWSLETDVVREAGRELPAELIQRFALAGTPRECADTLGDLLGAFPSISQVAIVPAGDAASTRTALHRFVDEVVPRAFVLRTGSV